MSAQNRVTINKLPTGVPGLDEIVGGGLPEFSFNIIAGAPGSGKTTLAHQFVFANATPERPALYFTVLGESAIKMLRYQQQYTFFDPARLTGAIRFINLSQVVLEKDLGAVLEEITKEVEKTNPAVVVVDSFRTMVRKPQSDMDLQSFIQRLALFLASWQATTFLIGEYAEEELRDNPIFTVADGLFWLRQTAERNSIVRKLQIIKLRVTMHSILDAVQKIGAKRLVIDSLAGFEMALSPGFRADFRESLYRMIFALTGIGVTILSTVEVDESFTEFPFSTYSISFLTDDIIRLRYVSIDGELRKIMVVIKMRGGNHAKEIREYEITSKGVVILGKRLTDYQGLISGIPVHSVRADQKEEPSDHPQIKA